MRNSNFFVYVLILLFFTLVGWLFYASYMHMEKNNNTSLKEGMGETLNKAGQKISNAGKKTRADADEDVAGGDYLYYDADEDEDGKSAKQTEKELAAKNAAADKKAGETKKLADAKLEAARKIELSEKAIAENKTSTKATKEKINRSPVKKEVPNEYSATKSKKAVTTGDQFLVIAGSYSVAANAELGASQLRKLGYADAEVTNFTSTKYKSVCVKKFDTRPGADKLVAELKSKKIDAYVHKKRHK